MYSQHSQLSGGVYHVQQTQSSSSTRYHSHSSPSSSPVPHHPSMNGQLERPQPHGTDLIGRPVHFVEGQFAGQTLRMELHEIQKADLGRKYARVDRRPLDPPPVVLLRIYHVLDPGTDRETEKEAKYDDLQAFGMLCTVDLFPVPDPDSGQPSPDHSVKAASAPPTQTTFSASSPSASSSSAYSPGHHHRSYSQQQLQHPHRPQILGNPFSGYILPSQTSPDIVHRFHDFPITENSKQTQALVGATFVQPSLVDYQGSKAIVFVFADLAVKIEGTFILRYRVFDIFSKPFNWTDDLAITAESYGGTFRVYSTKEFPGLQASTELTKVSMSLRSVHVDIEFCSFWHDGESG
ncbi:velvet factor-domain-containing protein [Crassisporium funariophilum]|nr:velvet factor-domain-containing protein [Crassisporium funariophilum]